MIKSDEEFGSVLDKTREIVRMMVDVIKTTDEIYEESNPNEKKVLKSIEKLQVKYLDGFKVVIKDIDEYLEEMERRMQRN